VTVLPRILEKIPVLLFAGDQDLICNYVGQESVIQSLTWNGGKGLGVCTGTSPSLQKLELNVSIGSRNSDLDRRRHAGWYMGFLAEFDICEGSFTRVITVLLQR
jgi:carboxypeptidase D